MSKMSDLHQIISVLIYSGESVETITETLNISESLVNPIYSQILREDLYEFDTEEL